MTAHVDIGGSETLSLKGALMVYQGRSRGFVSWHEARHASDGTPFLGEAQPLTLDFLNNLAAGLGSRTPVEILPENVLVRTAETIVWWTPATHRTMFFRGADEYARTLSGKRFPQPALVWRVTGQDLFLRALKHNRGPNAETQLMVAPYWNVRGEDGYTCQGTMRSPDDTGVASIALWERAFYQSEFTHQLGARRLTMHRDGFLGLWGSLADNPAPFPARHLVSASESLLGFVTREPR
ncbi:MAG: PRTRC system protein B [Bryobacterales bacterium]|nr:PRTRC system protein B [Bryobacterales bacterium]